MASLRSPALESGSGIGSVLSPQSFTTPPQKPLCVLQRKVSLHAMERGGTVQRPSRRPRQQSGALRGHPGHLRRAALSFDQSPRKRGRSTVLPFPVGHSHNSHQLLHCGFPCPLFCSVQLLLGLCSSGLAGLCWAPSWALPQQILNLTLLPCPTQDWG